MFLGSVSDGKDKRDTCPLHEKRDTQLRFVLAFAKWMEERWRLYASLEGIGRKWRGESGIRFCQKTVWLNIFRAISRI